MLLSQDHGAVRVLTLDRPEKKNAFNLELTDALWMSLEAASADPSVRVVVLTGSGDIFSAGADLNVFLEAATPKEGRDITRVGRLFEPLRACTKPTIAAVQGPAVGMGVTLLPHFDLVYAAESATFLTPFVKLGLVVEYGGSYWLERVIGASRAKELLLRAKPIDARTACDWGLVTRLFPRERLMDEVMAIAKDIADAPPGAVAETRRLMEHGRTHTLEEAFAEEGRTLATRYGSAENVEAVMAFLAARKK